MNNPEIARSTPAHTLHGSSGDRAQGSAFEASSGGEGNCVRQDRASPKTRKQRLPFGTWRREDGFICTVTGRVFQALSGLTQAGSRGITALDFPGGPAWRLPAYIHRLRHEHGLAIRRDWEPHNGGQHGRYVLEDVLRRVEAEGAH